MEWIFVLGVDLKRPIRANSRYVIVGHKTHKNCMKALEYARRFPSALIALTTGKSKKYRVFMGNGPMKECLLSAGVPDSRIVAPTYSDLSFNTNGEAQGFVRLLSKTKETDTHTVYMICRWFHAPRAYYLLRARLGERLRAQTTINVVPMLSLDLVDITLEPFKWVLASLRGHFFSS